MIDFHRIAAVALIAAPVFSPISANAFDGAEKTEIEQIVKDYLLSNPEIILEMQTAIEERQRVAEEEQRTQALAAAGDRIFNNPDDGVIGNANGDVTVVEFFDYNCSFCRRAHADLVTLKESDPKVRFVMKEFPILGPDSQAAHTVSMALQSVAPDLYGQFLDRLISDDERATEESAIVLARDLGVEEKALREAMTDPKIMGRVQETYELANLLNITGTPTYVIGNEVLSGAVGSAAIAERVANMRECASTSC